MAKETKSKKSSKKPKKSKKTDQKEVKIAEKSKSLNLEMKLATEVRELSKEIRKLKRLEFVKVLKHPWRLLGLSFLKGMMVGLGSVIGATVLVAILIYILSQVSFVPIIGDFIQEVLSQIETTQ